VIAAPSVSVYVIGDRDAADGILLVAES
jgi:hypothetical protein